MASCTRNKPKPVPSTQHRRNATFEITLFHCFILFLILTVAYSITIRIQRERRLRQYQFPSSLQRKLQQRFPQYSNAQWREVLEALRDWFAVARRARNLPLSMPSQAVDEAWHEFILMTRSYHDFCSSALGRYLHHVPAEAMRAPGQAQEGLRRAWKISCALERVNPRQPSHLPRLFVLDAAMSFPGGFHYALNCPPRADGSADAHCASHIGCSTGGSGCGTSGCSSDSGGSCGGGCGGD